ncbi:MAG: hypothetical protein ACYTEX_10980 [Planctomycetota bacterium]|jgi:hypothetical protein
MANRVVLYRRRWAPTVLVWAVAKLLSVMVVRWDYHLSIPGVPGFRYPGKVKVEISR